MGTVGLALALALALSGVSSARAVVWSARVTPFLAGEVRGVSCVSATACTVVGGVGTLRTLSDTGALGWDGKRWRVEATPDPDPARAGGLRANDFLSGVSCPSRKLCVAVGGYATGFTSPDGVHSVPVDMPLAERWNGVRWSLLPFPRLATGAQSGSLDAVSCPLARACVAVGRSDPGDALFAERWDGRRWSVQDVSTTAGVTDPSISGFSCSSSKACVAIGSSDFGVGDQTFAEWWDGRNWSPLPPPKVTGTYGTLLSSLSCTSPRLCVAVGEDFGSSRAVTLAERWNGANWTVQRTPDAPGGSNFLLSVSCTSGRACTAVGESGHEPVVERWDGSSWSLARTPSGHGAGLDAVSCTSSANCTAVGTTSCKAGPCSGAGRVVVMQSAARTNEPRDASGRSTRRAPPRTFSAVPRRGYAHAAAGNATAISSA
jgi:hypothetical protein